MVNRADSQAWQKAVLTLKAYADGSSLSVTIINRPATGTDSLTFPILDGLTGCGVNMGDYLPQSVGGSITINNTAESLGVERRFSDLLQRYSLTEQPVSVYVASTNLDDYAPASWTLAFQGQVDSITALPANGQLRLNVGARLFKPRQVCMQITSNDFPDAPESSLGNYLPIVFGQDVTVQPYRISADGAADVKYAYATAMGTSGTYDVVSSGIKKVYVKDYFGDYVSVVDAIDANTAIDSNTPTTDTTGFTTEIEWAAYNITPSENYLVTHVGIGCVGRGIGTSGEGTLKVRIYESDTESGNAPLEPCAAEGTAQDIDYSSEIASSSDYEVIIPLNKPLVMRASTLYWISVSQSLNDPDWEMTFVLRKRTTAASINVAFRGSYQGGSYVSSDAWSVYAGSRTHLTKYDLTWWLYGATIADYSVPASVSELNSEGYGASYFRLTQHDAISLPFSTPQNPSLDDLPIIVTMDGLENLSGLITDPRDAAVAMLSRFDGTEWQPDMFSTSNFSASHSPLTNTGHAFYRQLKGASRGGYSLTEILNQICRSSGCRMGILPDSSTPLGIWAYGTAGAVVDTLTNEDTVINRIDWAAVDTIVNRIRARAGWSLLSADPVKSWAQGSLSDYSLSISRGYGSDPAASWITESSFNTWGDRYLAEEAFEFCGDSTSLDKLSEIMLRRFSKPHCYCELETPFLEHSSIKLFDVIRIIHPSLPAFFGTSGAAKPITYSGSEADITQGGYFLRAEAYRAQVEGRTVDFDSAGFPVLKLTCRILDNEKDVT